MVRTMRDKKALPWVAAVLALLFCPSPEVEGAKHPVKARFCEGFYHDLEKTVGRTDRRDASVFPVAGFPFLRTTRFLEALRYFVADQAAWEQYLDLMLEEGMAAISKEVKNLPQADLEALVERWRAQRGGAPPASMALTEQATGVAAACAEGPMKRLRQMNPFHRLSWHHGTIPSPYRLKRRVLWAYPFWTVPMGVAITGYKSQVMRSYRTPLMERTPMGEIRWFSPPPESSQPLTHETVRAILEQAARNPLGIPKMEQDQLAALAGFYAPILEQDISGDYDIPGTMVWDDDRIGVDVTRPAVYYYGTHALLRGRPALQLNYVTWYTERPPRFVLDPQSGRLHGMTIRITLTPEGAPAMVDVIHNCGCYHFFFPAPDVFKSVRTELFREDAFVPQWLPTFQPPSRLTLRIGSENHWVERVRYDRIGGSSPLPYRLVPYGQLESLRRKTGERESGFDPQGLVKGETERLERFLLFSVGIPQIGSMRQRGHHGTALVGERVFDDPRLFEKLFFMKE
ncbi:MAG: hypothetical protein R3231_12825, partial [bacterium]|nr:hypothetical protein [bacterium]